MGRIDDGQLIKKAPHAGRNLAVLALLASGMAVLFAGLVLLAEDPPGLFWGLTASCAVIAAGYWSLAVAAKRGSPAAVTIVMVLMVCFLCISCVLVAIAYLKTGATPPISIVGAVVAILVLIALESSRQVLIKLRRRGLWEQVFGPAKATRGLCVAGGILLVVGVLAFHGNVVYSALNAMRARQEERRQAGAFLAMLGDEERAFFAALQPLGETFGDAELGRALEAAAALSAKATSLKAASTPDDPIHQVLVTYCKAVAQWRAGLNALDDPARFQNCLEAGDELRELAGKQFDDRYAPKR